MFFSRTPPRSSYRNSEVCTHVSGHTILGEVPPKFLALAVDENANLRSLLINAVPHLLDRDPLGRVLADDPAAEIAKKLNCPAAEAESLWRLAQWRFSRELLLGPVYSGA